MRDHKAVGMIHEVTTRAAVRDQGSEAFRQGRKVEDNPYWPGTDARVEWTSGFMGEKHKHTQHLA